MIPLRPSRRPKPPLAVEQFEDRTLPSGISFQFTFDDPQHQFDAYPALAANLQAAGQILSALLQGRGSLEVRVRPDNSIPRSSGGTVAVTFVRHEGGFDVLENGPITEARTGVDPNGAEPDLDLAFNVRDYLPTVWFDPSGAARTALLPAGKLDFMSVALHETLHALGFQGYRTIDAPGYGGFAQPFENTYDALTAFGAGGDPGVLYFVGAGAAARYGGPVPLTSVGPGQLLTPQNFFHVGNPAGRPGADLAGDLLNGMVFEYGKRYGVGELDLAILADLGWNLTPAPVQFSAAAYSVREQDGGVTITVRRTDGGAGAVSVRYATHGGSATAGADYDAVSGTLTWADGDVGSRSFTVPVFADGQVEGSETVYLTLSDPTGRAPLGGGSTAVLTILDVTPPIPQSAPLEGDVTGLVAVTLGAVRYNRRTRRFTQTVRLRNLSDRVIRGPLTLVLAGPSGRAAKRVRDAGPVASRWHTIPVGGLIPGESVTAALAFASPSGRRARSVLRLLAG